MSATFETESTTIGENGKIVLIPGEAIDSALERLHAYEELGITPTEIIRLIWELNEHNREREKWESEIKMLKAQNDGYKAQLAGLHKAYDNLKELYEQTRKKNKAYREARIPISVKLESEKRDREKGLKAALRRVFGKKGDIHDNSNK